MGGGARGLKGLGAILSLQTNQGTPREKKGSSALWLLPKRFRGGRPMSWRRGQGRGRRSRASMLFASCASSAWVLEKQRRYSVSARRVRQ